MKGSWFLFPFIGRKLRRLSLVFLSLRERDVRRKVIWKLWKLPVRIHLLSHSLSSKAGVLGSDA
jgi:hypothetical protein